MIIQPSSILVTDPYGPLSISGLNLLLQGDTGLYTDDGVTPATQAQAVKQWNDQSGNGNHVIQTTSGFRSKADVTNGLLQNEYSYTQRYALPANYSINSRAFTCCFLVQFAQTGLVWTGTANQAYHVFLEPTSDAFNPFVEGDANGGTVGYYNGASLILISGVYAPTRLALFTWVCGATDVKFYLNKTQYTGTVNAAATVTGGTLLNYADGVADLPLGAGVKDVMFFSRALTQAEVNDLVDYSEDKRGLRLDVISNIVYAGDSIAAGAAASGTGVTLNQNWPRLLALNSRIQQYNVSFAGGTLAAAITTRAAIVDGRFISGVTNVLVAPLGSNDIASAVAGSTLYAQLQSYAGACQNTGYKIVVPTILTRTDFTVGQEAQRVIFNNLLRADHSFLDGFFDPDADSRLQNAADTTYFPDGIHLTNAGSVIYASIASPVILALL